VVNTLIQKSELSVRRVLITGSNGFIGKNLIQHIKELDQYEISTFTRDNTIEQLQVLVNQADSIIHLAGENRPSNPSAFKTVNSDLTYAICEAIRNSGRSISLILASSIQAHNETPYGKSKYMAEQHAVRLGEELGNPTYIYSLPSVFGKWCKPNYNSVVATFCYNIAHGLPIQINDTSTQLRLTYVDDVVADFLRVIVQPSGGLSMQEIQPEYTITLTELADQICAFRDSRSSLLTENVGTGLIRALYSTYISYLKPQQFAYAVPKYADDRGVFVEMLKTKDSGQFTFFTAHPGVTRGGHYHHSKTEKFLVIKGKAQFRFLQIVTGEEYSITTNGDNFQVVETVPGWTHDITNVGEYELIVMLWSNEVFDRKNPDTYAYPI
jgi:UDP-2-acetamido-2,6-beta-L-arabino-hexul-4-ose reductase